MKIIFPNPFRDRDMKRYLTQNELLRALILTISMILMLFSGYMLTKSTFSIIIGIVFVIISVYLSPYNFMNPQITEKDKKEMLR